ncbi:APC family permease [Sphingobium boeckii]|uniref:Amino acid transporter n=1 Tax=Sphingobium boeckii TaxID=1082345 RepID=A0A7W9EE10_9SPHN|nr:APC family permease [Sphingobium boeckii]MBB5685697.1 amino acid transporter [Sphingobium boeckii]
MSDNGEKGIEAAIQGDGPEAGKLSGAIGVRTLTFMVVAFAAPLTVAAANVPLGALVGNGAGLPAMFLAGMVLLSLFTVGFVAMTPHVKHPGAFYSYIREALGRPMGVGSGMLALTAYAVNLVGVVAFVGASVANLLIQFGAPGGQWWIWALVAISLIGILGYKRIDLSGQVLGGLLIAETAIILVIDGAAIINVGPEGYSTGIIDPAAIFSGSPALGLMFAMLAFVGMESTAIFRDEVKDPARTIPRATYWALGLIGFLYALTSWSMVTAWGDSHFLNRVTADPGTMLVDTAFIVAGKVAADITSILIVTSAFAACLSLHNVVARYQFSLANSGVLPRGLGRVHPTHGSPAIASYVTTLWTLAGILAAVVLGLDPIVEVATWSGGIAGVGVVILMMLTCVAVVVFFRKNPVDTRPWHTLVAPSLGVIGLAMVVCLEFKNLPLLMGGSVPLGIVAGALIALAFFGGAGWALARPSAGLSIAPVVG